MQYTLTDLDHLEISKGVLLKAVRMRAELGDLGAAEDIATALDGIGPLMAACKWDELIRRSTVLISQAKGDGA